MRRFLEGKGELERVVFCCFLEKDVREYERVLPVVFPPTEGELAARKKEDVKDVEGSAGGSAEDKEAEAPEGESDKAKADEEVDEEWETVEKPGEEETASLAEPKKDGTMKKEESSKSSGHEGKTPGNMLQKDW